MFHKRFCWTMIWLGWYSSGLCVLIDIFWWQGSIEKGSQSVYLGTGPYQYYVNIDMISWYSILRPLVKGQSVAQFYHNLTSADWQTSSVWSPRIISECYLCWGQLSLGPGDWMRCKDGYHQHIQGGPKNIVFTLRSIFSKVMHRSLSNFRISFFFAWILRFQNY